jgi:hypothetical protein
MYAISRSDGFDLILITTQPNKVAEAAASERM